MKRLSYLILPILSLCLMLACNLSGGQESVDEAIAGTLAAQEAAQAEIDAAVQATTAAMPTLALEPVATATTVVVTNTVVVTTNVVVTVVSEPPIETATDYTTMSEDELLLYIDQTVNEAVAATSASANASSSATSDGEVNSGEVETVMVYVSDAEAAVALAEELIDYYDVVYGDSATAAVAELAAIEAELAAINDSLIALNATLIEIDATLAAGLALAEESIAQLENAAALTAGSAAMAMSNLQLQPEEIAALVAGLQAANANNIAATSEQFADMLTQIQANEIANNPTGAIAQVETYISLVQGAIADNSLSAEEFAAIAQASANAQASLNGLGGGNFSGLSQAIDQLTTQLASGYLNDALGAVNSLATSVPALPSVPAGGRP